MNPDEIGGARDWGGDAAEPKDDDVSRETSTLAADLADSLAQAFGKIPGGRVYVGVPRAQPDYYPGKFKLERLDRDLTKLYWMFAALVWLIVLKDLRENYRREDRRDAV